jgi:hypothetical protein
LKNASPSPSSSFSSPKKILIEFDRHFDVAYFNGDVITAVQMIYISRDIRLLRVFRQRQQDVQQRALAEGNAQPHRWARDQRYVTGIAHDAQNLDSTMGLIRISHRYLVCERDVALWEPVHAEPKKTGTDALELLGKYAGPFSEIQHHEFSGK